MWAKNKKPNRTAQIDSLIGQNTEIQGDVIFSGGLHVDGSIKGSVLAEGAGEDSLLTLSERGTIEGEVKVPNVVVNGRIIGDVHAQGHVELAAHARVDGNVYYSLIEMAMGAEVNGNLVHKSSNHSPSETGSGTEDS
ncbi:bactofilin family protein [Thiohalophilus thiocyanatoxydans]|uniref:Cytoskeletal protein CcmA (Bactofilin family) n=1 Tax=Thiohalophilus thiocyanatoxydans TaxID=381308 RepID=A0A4V3H3S8_9GAMM|nr:polymer-forming cytoskeletal protein [Thiohalophilus thiocyanatoxydans]TDY00455.1 cytoskeletal protein CcmA (bactofilin family) [Thiohalophilus thiocyanatoxydans]